MSASPQTCHYKLIDSLCVPAISECCRPLFLLCPGASKSVSEGDWQEDERKRWTLKNRNSVQRGRQVQKVIGNGRTG